MGRGLDWAALDGNAGMPVITLLLVGFREYVALESGDVGFTLDGCIILPHMGQLIFTVTLTALGI